MYGWPQEALVLLDLLVKQRQSNLFQRCVYQLLLCFEFRRMEIEA